MQEDDRRPPAGVHLWARHVPAATPADGLQEWGNLLPSAFRPVYNFFFQRMQQRSFQRLVLANVLQHTLGGSTAAAVVQAPTGSGKSLALLAEAFVGKGLPSFRTPPAQPCRYRVLILKPDRAIRNQTAKAAVRIGNALQDAVPGTSLRVVSVAATQGQAQLAAYEIQSPLRNDSQLDPDLKQADVVVCNYHRLTDDVLNRMPADFFSRIIIDEGHHLGAERYVAILHRFNRAHVTSYTATPEREDGRHLLTEDFLPLQWVFYMSKQRAWEDAFIKRPLFVEPYCTSLQLAKLDGDQPATLAQRHVQDGTVEMVVDERPEWGNLLRRREINKLCAVSPDIRKDCLLTTLRLLTRQRLLSGTRHIALVKAGSITEAKAICDAFGRIKWELGQGEAPQVNGPGVVPVAVAELVVGNMKQAYPALTQPQADQRKAEVLERAERGLLDVLVIVEMLKEGWSNLLVSVVTFLDPVLSSITVEQVAGRGARLLLAPGGADDQNHPAAAAFAAGSFFRAAWGLREGDQQADRRQQWGIDAPEAVQPQEQTCFIVAHETLNMGGTLRAAGVVTDAPDMHVVVPGGDGLLHQRGARGERDGERVDDSGRSDQPTVVYKGDAALLFGFGSLAGSQAQPEDLAAVSTEGNSMLAQINRRTHEANVAAPPQAAAANPQLAAMGEALQHIHQAWQQLINGA